VQSTTGTVFNGSSANNFGYNFSSDGMIFRILVEI